MTARVAVSAVLIAIALGLATEARADEAFLCGPDTVVYVAAADLEAKKRSDPCIAQYFGLTVEAPSPIAPKPTPTSKPAQVSAPALKAKPKAPALRSVTEASVERKSSERQASMMMATAVGTDYRNVRIINATSEQGAWYHHDR